VQHVTITHSDHQMIRRMIGVNIQVISVVLLYCIILFSHY